MRGKGEGLYLYTRHSADCKHADIGIDRDESRRCNCVRYVAGTAPDGTKFRSSTGTSSWEKARKFLARTLAEHDPLRSVLMSVANIDVGKPALNRKSVKESVDDFLAAKRGESIVDMGHYEGLFERELLPWCKEQGIFDLAELDLHATTKFRNQLKNKATVKNRKLSRLRSFFEFCRDRRWVTENPAKKLKPAQEDEPDVDYFHASEITRLLAACRSHTWKRGRDFRHRGERLRALLLFMRWTGLSIGDCVRFETHRLQKNKRGVWNVLLRRQKNGNPVFVAIPPDVAKAVTKLPPLSETHFFWSGEGHPNSCSSDWRRSLGLVFRAAKLKRQGRLLRCHPHMMRHAFAIEKLLAGAALEDVSLLLGHHTIKVTEKHYLKFDQRRQERLTRASMVDWDQIKEKKAAGAS